MPVALYQAVGLEAVASLVVASMDLELVRLLRGAMLVADLQGAGCGIGGPGHPGHCCDRDDPRCDVYEPRRHIHPEPVYEPRRHIHPEPRVEPRPLLQPATRLANQGCDCPEYVAPAASKSPIEPPWKVLPWKNPPAPPPKVKYILHRPDIARSKGAFVNVFA